MIKILFICYGNICRSTMSQSVFTYLVRQAGLEDCFEIDSAATSREEIGNPPHYGTRNKLRQVQIPLIAHHARQMTRQDYENFDFLIGMDSANIRNMTRIVGGDEEHKIYKMLSFADYEKTHQLSAARDVADPWYTGDFDATYDDILRGCRGLLASVEGFDFSQDCCILRRIAEVYRGITGDNNMELQNGRPADAAGRMEKEIRTYNFLDELGVDYQRVDHEAAFTMNACRDIDALLETEMCKNLFLCNRQKTDFYLLLISGEKTFKTKELSQQIGSARLSFAGAEYMEKYLDITPGSVSIMGLMNDKDNAVRLLVDEDLLKEEWIGCHPCVNTSSIRVKTKDMFDTVMKAMHHEMTVVKLTGEENK